MYGSVSIKSAIVKHEGVWRNFVTIVIPLHRLEQGVKRTMDYGDFAIVEELASVDEIKEIIKKFPEDVTGEIVIGGYKVIMEGFFETPHEYDSSDEHLRIGWTFERYYYTSRSRPPNPKEPLVSSGLPLFPGVREAIRKCLNTDISRWDIRGTVICLPNYGARIEEVKIGTEGLSLKIHTLEADEKDLLGKVYCERSEEIKQEDTNFSNGLGTVTVGFKPDHVEIALVSISKNEILDSRRIYLSWPTLPRGVLIDIPEYELRELIKHGEDERLEFKETISKPEEFAETVVAFANSKGGIILLGVNDQSRIVSITAPNIEDTIANILRSRCEPSIKYTVDRRNIDEKDIIMVKVEEGQDKPYFVRDKGPYIRANATDRIATRYELDEIYRRKH
jgi:hypothetical protein